MLKSRLFYMTPVVALALSACGNDVNMTNATPEQVAKQVADKGALNLRPGQWETTIQIKKVEIPGMPAGTDERMTQTMMQNQQVHRVCITPEEARKPPVKLLGQDSQNCTYEKFEISGNEIDAKLVCKADGNTMRIELDGKFHGDTFELDNDTENLMSGGQRMKIDARTIGRRLGDCPSS